MARAAFYCGEAAPPRSQRSRTVWVLLRVSLDVATNSYPRCGAETNSMKAIEMCGLPSQGRLVAACIERWGRVATRGGVQAPQNPGLLEFRLACRGCTSCTKRAGATDKLAAAHSSLVIPKTSPSSLCRKVTTAVHA